MNTKSYNAAIEKSNNWGIYVMVSRYADKDGNTPCMPNGYAPDIEVSDDPLDGYELGDERETMLSVALNGIAPKAPSSGRVHHQVLETSHNPQVRIITPRNIFAK